MKLSLLSSLWSTEKQVSTFSNFPVFGSYIATCLPDCAIGKYLPYLFAPSPPHHLGCCLLSRVRSVNQTRPLPSMPTLRGSPLRFHMSAPKFGDGVGAALNPDTNGGALVGVLMMRAL